MLNPDLIEKYLTEHRKVIISSILIAVLSYGYEIFNFSLSIDEELASFTNASQGLFLLEIGRWGTYLLNNLFFSHSLLPYAPFLFGVLGLAAASAMFINSIPGSFGAKLVFSFIFISSPVHAYYLAFNTADPYFSIGLIMTIVSYLKAVKGFEFNNKKALISSVLMFAFAISIYQALVSVFITLIIFYLLLKKLESTEINNIILLKRAGKFFLLFASSVILYKLTDFLIHMLFIPPDQNFGQEYLNNLKGWGKNSFQTTGRYIIQLILDYFKGAGYVGGRLIVPFSVFSLLLVLILNFSMLKRSLIERIILILLLLIFLVSPFFLICMLGEYLPVRTMMAFPLMLAILWWLAFKQFSPSGKKIVYILVFTFFIIQTGNITRLFYSSWSSWQADRALANRIYDRICNLDIPVTLKSVPVMIVGMYDHPTNEFFLKSEIFGASFFGWDKGNPARMLHFFKTMGINNLTMVPENLIREEYPDTLFKIPAWPHKGSVCIINNVVVVKLSNASE